MDKLVILRRRKLGMSSAKGIAEKSATGIRWTRNDFEADRQPHEDEVCIRWGCTSNIATKRVINTARAIHQVNDKGAFRMLLDEHELCPRTFTTLEQIIDAMEPDDEGDFMATEFKDGKIFMRPSRHAQGRNIHICNNMHEVVEAIKKCGIGWYASELVPKEREFRVCVVQGRVAWVAEKTPADKNAIAWNVAQGGRFDNVRWGDWPLKAVHYAVEAFELSELDFGGVDIMIDDQGDPYVIEINSAPSLTSDYRQQCMAKCFDYIAEHGKARIPRVEQRGDWKKFIHPALSDRTLMVNA